MNLYELYVKLGLDSSEFDRGIQNAKTETASFGGNLKSVFGGTLLADFAKQAGQALFQFGMDSIGVASDLEEVQNVVDVTFGNGASQIDAWAKSAKNAFGMGELNAKRFSGTMGAMLKSMGMTDEQAMDMSTSLVQLAGDMASFYNLDHETAFEKIRAGISGETEPLKQLGINMSVANLETYAMSQGIDKAYNSMTQMEQATLRYNYLLEATAGAQGDFARTADGYANQVRIFGENINEIKAGMGKSLLDFVTPALTTFNEWYAQLTSTTVQEQINDVEQTEAEELLNADTRQAKAETLIQTIEELQRKTELSETETALWEASLRELYNVFPELANVIDLTNMSISGTADELRQTTNQAWMSAREMAKINALKQKEQIRADAIQAAADAELAWRLKQGEREAAEAKLMPLVSSIAKDAGLSEDDVFALYALSSSRKATAGEFTNWGADVTQAHEAAALFDSWETLSSAEDDLYNAYKSANEEAETAIANYQQSYDAISDIVDATNQQEEATRAATKAQTDYNDALSASATAFTEMETAWQAVKQYREEVHGQMVESLKNGTADLWGVVADMTEMDVQGSLAAAKANIEANTAFYTEYALGLRSAMGAGLNQELLNELAQNRTAENKALLDYIRSGATPEELAELNAAWANLSSSKETLAEGMTDAALSVDDAYAAMVQSATEATEKFNQYEEARAAAAETVKGVVDGLDSQIVELQAKVDQINGIIATIGGNVDVHLMSQDIGADVNSAASAMQTAVENGIAMGMSRARVVVSASEMGNAIGPYVNRMIFNTAIAGRFESR